MTTIVANLECMAADTRVVNEGPIYNANKIFRVGESLCGTAGDAFASLAFLDWFGGKRNIQALRKLFEHEDKASFVILELNPQGLFLWNGWGFSEALHNKSYAIGSGSMSAMNSMLRNESPEEAVRSTFPLDENTGGAVQIEYLLPPELAPKRKRG
jgi:hypothetical protein